jgi:hypothetical protein
MSVEEAADNWDLPLDAIDEKESLLSLKLLLDEDSQAKYLVNLLRGVGHDVFTVYETGLDRLQIFQLFTLNILSCALKSRWF